MGKLNFCQVNNHDCLDIFALYSLPSGAQRGATCPTFMRMPSFLTNISTPNLNSLPPLPTYQPSHRWTGTPLTRPYGPPDGMARNCLLSPRAPLHLTNPASAGRGQSGAATLLSWNLRSFA